MHLPVALFFALIHIVLSLKTYPFVITTTGAVHGKKVIILGKEIDRYIGIPYATPPVGDLRFRKPEPLKPWKGLYEATKKPPPCVQYNVIQLPVIPKNEDVSEDCLYLNVWMPHQDEVKEPLKAIMVWIHGGAFHLGESSSDIYDGGILAAYGDVIVASMNYRLGIFGFLNADVEEAPGNMGLLDQVLALRWIKDNAKALGGDPDRITIFGESAGSVSVGLHVLSPLSRGLFSRAILQSGTPYHMMGGESSCVGPVKGDKVAKAVGCIKGTKLLVSHPQEIVSCLKGKDARLLSKAEAVTFGTNFRFLPRFGDDFMPHNPISAIRDGKFDPTRVMVGINSNEGALLTLFWGIRAFLRETPPKFSIKDAEKHISKIFMDPFASVHKEIAGYYLKGIEDGDYTAIAKAVLDAVGDYLFVCPSIFFSESLIKAGSTVYFYIFEHYPSTSFFKPWIGSTHFDEVQFVFGEPFKESKKYTKEEEVLSRSMMEKWIAFAKEGNPQVSESEPWPNFITEDRAYIRIQTQEQTAEYGLNMTRCPFWKGLIT